MMLGDGGRVDELEVDDARRRKRFDEPQLGVGRRDGGRGGLGR